MFVFADIKEFGEIPSIDLKKYKGRLILYGAGKVSDVVDYVLRQQGIEYLCYCDTYRAGEIRNGHEVISLDELREKYEGVPILITTIHHRSVVDILQEYGERDIFDCISLLTRVDFSDWGKHGEQMTLEWAERTISSYLTTMLSLKNHRYVQEVSVLVTQKCNLRCIDCSGMAPFFQNPKHYAPEPIIQSLHNLCSCKDIVIDTICLLGGETLLYPHLFQVLKATLALDGINNVSIVTNGTLLPNPELIPLMQNERFFIRLSDYGNLSRKLPELIDFLEYNKIKYEVDNYAEWYENRKHFVAYCDEEEATRKYKLCTNIKYRILLEGRFFPCCKAAQLCQMGLFEPNDDNSVDCMTEENLFERLRTGLKRLEECDHIDICHRCYGIPQIHPDHMVPAAQQADGPLYLRLSSEED